MMEADREENFKKREKVASVVLTSRHSILLVSVLRCEEC